jgi:hypothetical protein
MKTILKFLIAIAIAVLLFKCGVTKQELIGYRSIPISQLNSQPELFAKGVEPVQLEGIVSESFDMIELLRHIEVCDESNNCIKAIPLSSTSLPSVGQEVEMIGNTEQILKIGSESVIIFKETVIK